MSTASRDQLIVYVDRSRIRSGKAEEVRGRVADLVRFIEEREPQLLAYEFYFDEAAGDMTVVAIHPDCDSLLQHMEIGGSAFQGFRDLIDLRSIQVYGHPSDEVLRRLQDKADMLGDEGRVEVHALQSGFHRLSPDTVLTTTG